MYISQFNTIGTIIYHLRTQKQISQSFLSKGLCSPTTLCRIESGEREPDKLLADALLQRLGTSPNRFDFFLNEDEFYFFQKRETIKSLMKSNQYFQAKKELLLYKKQLKQLTPLQLQFINKQKGLQTWFLYQDYNLSMKQLKKSLFITLPTYKTSNLPKLFLTLEEISILYEIASIYKSTGNNSRSLFILSQLITYLDNNFIDEEEQIRLYNSILFSAAYQYYLQQNYSHTLHLCNKGIFSASNNGKLLHLPELLCLRALSQEKFYNKTISSPIQLSCLKDYYTATSLYSLHQEKNKINEINNYIKEIYSWESIQSAMLFKSQELLLN